MRTTILTHLLMLLAIFSVTSGCESTAETPAMPPSSQPTTIDLSTYQWQNRVIVIFAPAATDANAVQQRTSLNADPQAIGDRDLVIVEVIGDRHHTAAVRQQYGVPTSQFTVLLIGKDAGEKLRATEPVEPAAIFRLIDSMPMRQREMRR
ncbi:MAG TPA: DUF4174 domain-containing protein [Tepidisphaeraceae bacterium]|jgi:hypothetical protein|nr:DUF4174 domain-containing protein [Tepidisphaeraceae bacterium]